MRIDVHLNGKHSQAIELNFTDKQVREIKKHIGYQADDEIKRMFSQAAQSLYSDLRKKNIYPCISYLQVKESFESGVDKKIAAVFEIFQAIGIQAEADVIVIIKDIFGLEAAMPENEFIKSLCPTSANAANENQTSRGV